MIVPGGLVGEEAEGDDGQVASGLGVPGDGRRAMGMSRFKTCLPARSYEYARDP